MFNERMDLLLFALWQTFEMVGISGALSVIFGIPLGFVLMTTRKRGLLENPMVNAIVGILTNGFRSVPFIILLVAIVPFTRWVVGTSIGTAAAIVPLTVGAIPFVGRIVENALNEVPESLLEMGRAAGATPLQIMTKILLPESLPAVSQGITVTLVTLVGYSAMAGAVGGGGLGDVAIRYGYQRFDVTVMAFTVLVLILLVQGIQSFGDWIYRRLVK